MNWRWWVAVFVALTCCAGIAVSWMVTPGDQPADASIVRAIDDGRRAVVEPGVFGAWNPRALYTRYMASAWERGGFESALRANGIAHGIAVGMMALGGWFLLLAGVRLVRGSPLGGSLLGWGMMLGILASLGLAAWGVVRGLGGEEDGPRDARLFLPLDLAEHLDADHDPIYANPSAFPFLELLGKTPPGRGESEYLRALGNPSHWRALDRNVRFGSVVLSGPPAEYRPLLRHLNESPDWRLEYLDNHGMVFVRRPGLRWTFAEPERWEAEFPDPGERAVFLSQAALNLAAVERFRGARRALDAAVELDGGRPEVLARYASFEADRERWGEALALAERALEVLPEYSPAMQVKVHALLELGRPEAAWESADRLKRAAPEDPFALFLYAKAANAAGAIGGEAEALERLVDLSRRRGLPDTSYRLYLGQAYARQGQAAAAAEQFRTVLESDVLGAEQEQQVREMLEAIESQGAY